MDEQPKDSGKLKLRNTDTNRFKVDTGRLRVQAAAGHGPDVAASSAGATQKATTFSDPINLRDTSTNKLRRLEGQEAVGTTVTSASAPAEKKSETVRLKVVRATPRPNLVASQPAAAPLANVPLTASSESPKSVTETVKGIKVFQKPGTPAMDPGATTNLAAETPQVQYVGEDVPPSAVKAPETPAPAEAPKAEAKPAPATPAAAAPSKTATVTLKKISVAPPSAPAEAPKPEVKVAPAPAVAPKAEVKVAPAPAVAPKAEVKVAPAPAPATPSKTATVTVKKVTLSPATTPVAEPTVAVKPAVAPAPTPVAPKPAGITASPASAEASKSSTVRLAVKKVAPMPAREAVAPAPGVPKPVAEPTVAVKPPQADPSQTVKVDAPGKLHSTGSKISLKKDPEEEAPAPKPAEKPEVADVAKSEATTAGPQDKAEVAPKVAPEQKQKADPATVLEPVLDNFGTNSGDGISKKDCILAIAATIALAATLYSQIMDFLKQL